MTERILQVTVLLILQALVPGDSHAQPDSWSPRADMPTARHAGASCVLDGKLYVIGGFDGASAPPLPVVEVYDPQTDQWTNGPRLPGGRLQLTASAVGGRCYAIGGRDEAGRGSNGVSTAEVLDPVTRTWSSVADMPTPRFAPGSAALNGRIHVFGGGFSETTIDGTHEIYDPVSNSWSTASPMPTGRGLIATATLDGRIYAIGGTLDALSGFSVVEVFDPATGQWSRAADLPTARFAATASVANGKIYVFGGSDGLSLDVVEEYDPNSDTWTTRQPMPGARTLAPVSANIDGTIYVVGGARVIFPPHRAVTTNEAYRPPSDQAAFVVNAGLTGAWFNPDTPGQGFLIEPIPSSGDFFAAWFTFDEAQDKVGSPDHRWFTLQGSYQGDTAVLSIFRNAGGTFLGPDAVTTESVGSATLQFLDCTSARLDYLFDQGPANSLDLVRLTPETLCTTTR